MTFETDYNLYQFRKIQNQYFWEDNTCQEAIVPANMKNIMEQMLLLINQMEIEIEELHQTKF